MAARANNRTAPLAQSGLTLAGTLAIALVFYARGDLPLQPTLGPGVLKWADHELLDFSRSVGRQLQLQGPLAAFQFKSRRVRAIAAQPAPELTSIGRANHAF